MPLDDNTSVVNDIFNTAINECRRFRNQFILPEHLLMALSSYKDFASVLTVYGEDVMKFRNKIFTYLSKVEKVPEFMKYDPEISAQFSVLIDKAYNDMIDCNSPKLTVVNLVRALLTMNKSWAQRTLSRALKENVDKFLTDIAKVYAQKEGPELEKSTNETNGAKKEKDDFDDFNEGFDFDEEESVPWQSMVTCLNDVVAKHNPLIGREQEMERTIQVLCRKDKNNPLHVGESGVGKTALVYGLVQRIVDGNVPKRLKKCKVYMLDLGSMLAGTQFRGDFEKRIKNVMDGISEEKNAIVYIDEIHNLVGAGRINEGSMDASNMLKPYLEAGEIRFIGSTTYQEYNRYFSKNVGMVRRFQQIDIPEPSVEDTINIINGLKNIYEKYHHVSYLAPAIDFAVRASAKYVNDRFLPDKAIDLIDEAGAYREIHPLDAKRQVIDKALIANILSKTCKVDALAIKDDDEEKLITLRERIANKIYGQDEAVKQVVEAVQMSKAGLMDDNKPLSSLLFVGPTGVGKTEVARVLAEELGVSLVRFDMSEYTEKHTVAKLIGSPAGYIGYEDGGLLTDAIRKTPNCVLLLDEIEKAHEDIYNILLQVMDYAKLTDNKGNKADFRNVVLIMTSNAGAQFASQASVGFNGNVTMGEAMLKQVKRTFKPEFMNRLSATVVFNDMDRKMATLILNKKLNELQQKLTARKVTMTLTDEARTLLLEKGITREFGAREIDRVIASLLKPLFTHEILFGSLKDGGKATVEVENGSLILKTE
jgi:ATP-dependent Clp protease ATP-binding subunit ClpA